MKNIAVNATSSQDTLYTEIQAGAKTFYADEPLRIGGTDLAPNPVEYFLASLASCTSITIQLYAKRKGWNIGKVTVSVTLVEDNGQERAINKKILFENEVSYEQKERLMMIAEKCPVAKLIHENLSINVNNG